MTASYARAERLVRSLTVLSFLSLVPAAQQYVVTDGSTLARTVETVPDGAVIELHTDATLVTSLVVRDRSLTIRAADGYSPTLQGEFGKPAIELVGGKSPAAAKLVGLELVGGLGITTMRPAAVRVRDVENEVGSTTLNLADCQLRSSVDVFARGQQAFDVTILRCSLDAGVRINANDLAIGTLDAEDCAIRGDLRIDSRDVASVTARVRRTRIDGRALYLGSEAGSVIALLESSLLVADDAAKNVGLAVFGAVGAMNVRVVNATISGYEVGAVAPGGTAIVTNSVFHANDHDVGPGLLPGQLLYSLGASEAFGEGSGNLRGEAQLDESFSLIGLGVDAGLSSAVGLGTRDLYGKERIQDANGDGLVNVSMGAVETQGSCEETRDDCGV